MSDKGKPRDLKKGENFRKNISSTVVCALLLLSLTSQIGVLADGYSAENLHRSYGGKRVGDYYVLGPKEVLDEHNKSRRQIERESRCKNSKKRTCEEASESSPPKKFRPENQDNIDNAVAPECMVPLNPAVPLQDLMATNALFQQMYWQQFMFFHQQASQLQQQQQQQTEIPFPGVATFFPAPAAEGQSI